MKLNDLRKTKWHASSFECHRQSWRQDREWLGYRDFPRPHHGFILIVSDLKMHFSLQDGRTLEAKKGDLVFAPKGVRYVVQCSTPCPAFDSYTVNFLLQNEQSDEIFLEDKMQILKEKTDSALFLAAEELFGAYIGREANQIKAMSEFYRFFDRALSLAEVHWCSQYPIQKGIDRLTAEWNENKKIEFYAALCGVDESYFYRLFKEWSGLSPNQYRNRLRVAAAKDLLVHTNLSVGEIAQKVGFYDPYYFSRLFKKEVGLSPEHYKYRQIQEHSLK